MAAVIRDQVQRSVCPYVYTSPCSRPLDPSPVQQQGTHRVIVAHVDHAQGAGGGRGSCASHMGAFLPDHLREVARGCRVARGAVAVVRVLLHTHKHTTHSRRASPRMGEAAVELILA